MHQIYCGLQGFAQTPLGKLVILPQTPYSAGKKCPSIFFIPTPAVPWPLPLKKFLWAPMCTDAIICHSEKWKGEIRHLTSYRFNITGAGGHRRGACVVWARENRRLCHWWLTCSHSVDNYDKKNISIMQSLAWYCQYTYSKVNTICVLLCKRLEISSEHYH